MSTILALLCKQASYPGRGAALGTVAGGLAGYGLADEDQRIEGAAAGAALGGLGGYGLGRAYTHRPLGPAITDKARLLGAGGEGASGLDELFAEYPTRSSLLERAHGGAAVAPPNDSTAKALTRHVHKNLAGGAGIGAVSAGYASDEEDRNTSMLRGAMGGAILGGMVSIPHVVATKHLMGPETEHAARIARGNNGRKTRDLGELVEKQRGVAARFGTMGHVVGAPLIAMNGVNVAEEVRKEKNASFIPRVAINQGLAGTALGAAGGALAGGEDHRMQGAAMGAVTGGIAGLGTGAMAHRAYNAAHAPLAKREQLSKLVQQGILDQTPSPLGRAMVTAQGDDARRTIREGVTQAAQDSSKMTRRVGGTLGTLGAMGVAETLRAQPKTASAGEKAINVIGHALDRPVRAGALLGATGGGISGAATAEEGERLQGAAIGTLVGAGSGAAAARALRNPVHRYVEGLLDTADSRMRAADAFQRGAHPDPSAYSGMSDVGLEALSKAKRDHMLRHWLPRIGVASTVPALAVGSAAGAASGPALSALTEDEAAKTASILDGIFGVA